MPTSRKLRQPIDFIDEDEWSGYGLRPTQTEPLAERHALDKHTQEADMPIDRWSQRRLPRLNTEQAFREQESLKAAEEVNIPYCEGYTLKPLSEAYNYSWNRYTCTRLPFDKARLFSMANDHISESKKDARGAFDDLTVEQQSAVAKMIVARCTPQTVNHGRFKLLDIRKLEQVRPRGSTQIQRTTVALEVTLTYRDSKGISRRPSTGFPDVQALAINTSIPEGLDGLKFENTNPVKPLSPLSETHASTATEDTLHPAKRLGEIDGRESEIDEPTAEGQMQRSPHGSLKVKIKSNIQVVPQPLVYSGRRPVTSTSEREPVGNEPSSRRDHQWRIPQQDNAEQSTWTPHLDVEPATLPTAERAWVWPWDPSIASSSSSGSMSNDEEPPPVRMANSLDESSTRDLAQVGYARLVDLSGIQGRRSDGIPKSAGENTLTIADTQTSRESQPFWSEGDTLTSITSADDLVQPKLLDTTDRMTIVSTSDGTIGLPEQSKLHLASLIAAHVTEQIRGELSLSHDELEQLLRTFALMQEHSTCTSNDRKAAQMFRQQRRLIAQHILEPHVSGSSQSSGSAAREPFQESLAELQDKVLAWTVTLDDDSNYIGSIEVHEEPDNPEEELELSQAQALQVLISSTSWQWLIERVQRTHLSIPQSGISQEMLTILLESKRSELVHTIQYVLGCSIDDLYRSDEQYGRLLDMITLTSDGRHTQALTCAEYVDLVWPRGRKIIEAVQTLLDTGPHRTSIAPDFEIILQEPLSISAQGPIALLLELGEVLAWLGACITPSETFTNVQPAVRRVNDHIRIDYTQTLIPLDGASCWRDLFGTASIASIFPIAARQHAAGLEMSLETMITLGGTRWATSWSSKFMLKGLCSMFYPVVDYGTELLWHFKHTTGDYLSHVEGRDSCITGNISLTSHRHFVGWTPSVKTTIGSHTDYTSLREPSRTQTAHGLVLEKATLGVSQYLGANITLAKHRTPSVWLNNSTSYESVLASASNILVILFDTASRRGYLTDGCSTLLHLSCSRLHSRNANRTGIKPTQFHYSQAGRPDITRSINILLNNRKLVLRENRKEEIEEVLTHGHWQRTIKARITQYTFEDLVMEMWQYLSKIFDYQTTPPSGIDIRLTDRDRLEGWSFKSIVDHIPLLKPQMVYLNSSGRGWSDFVRNAGAVTLMADHFGDILRDAASICPAWTSIPVNLDYLAAPVSLLREVYERGRDERDFPASLGFGTLWHMPHLLFEPCTTCRPGSHCDRLQTLLPRSFLGRRRLPHALSDDSAVVFGHAAHHEFRWPQSSKHVIERLKGVFTAPKIRNPKQRADTAESQPLYDDAAPMIGIPQPRGPHDRESARAGSVSTNSAQTSGSRDAALSLPGLREIDSDSTAATSLVLNLSQSTLPDRTSEGLQQGELKQEPTTYTAPVVVSGSRQLRRKHRFVIDSEAKAE